MSRVMRVRKFDLGALETIRRFVLEAAHAFGFAPHPHLDAIGAAVVASARLGLSEGARAARVVVAFVDGMLEVRLDGHGEHAETFLYRT